MRLPLIRLILLLAGCGPLSACTTPYTPSDIGTTPCRQWTREHSAKSVRAETLDKWMFDYFRAHDLKIGPKEAWGRGEYTEFSVAWFVSGVCESHPRWTIEETAKRLIAGARRLMLEAVT